MNSPASKRSFTQWVVSGVFGLLAAAFFLRAILYGSKWLRHVTEGDANFKVLTIWCLVYMAVCAAISLVAFRFPRDESTEPAGSGSV